MKNVLKQEMQSLDRTLYSIVPNKYCTVGQTSLTQTSINQIKTNTLFIVIIVIVEKQIIGKFP
jgi:hypothetical protein